MDLESVDGEDAANLLVSLHENGGNNWDLEIESHSTEKMQAKLKCSSNGNNVEQKERKRGQKLGIKDHAVQEEEDVCFVCLDGGKLILCDKRTCPKAYHMKCTGRDREYFRKEGQWFCGWHICECSRPANIQCYTCPKAYCNGCIKEADFVCVRRAQGLCESCYELVHMIEHNSSVDSDGAVVDFDNEETYEYFFKAYWKDLKEKLSLTWSEIDTAKRAKDNGQPFNQSIQEDKLMAARRSQRLKRKRVPISTVQDDSSISDEGKENISDYEEERQEDEGKVFAHHDDEESLSKSRKGRQKICKFSCWASKELEDFLCYIKEDSKQPLSLLSINKIVLDYIEENKLHSGHSGQIRCDERLQRLFGKKNITKSKIPELLKMHVASKLSYSKSEEDFINCWAGLDADKGQKHSKSRKKLDKSSQPELDPSSYAAINVENISLIYLKRSLLEVLLQGPNFESKVTGTFVRIRVPSMPNTSDTCYRLVQVVGVKQALDPCQSNGRPAYVLLEILNLHKREEITVDLVSSQNFTEEECQRLRQSIRCGLLKAITVGELQEKAEVLREVKVKEWFDAELVRLTHLRDRASEKGHRKEEKELQAPIVISADLSMEPGYESDNSNKKTEGTGNILEAQSSKVHQKISADDTNCTSIGWMEELGSTKAFEVEESVPSKKSDGWEVSKREGGFKGSTCNDGWGSDGDGWGRDGDGWGSDDDGWARKKGKIVETEEGICNPASDLKWDKDASSGKQSAGVTQMGKMEHLEVDDCMKNHELDKLESNADNGLKNHSKGPNDCWGRIQVGDEDRIRQSNGSSIKEDGWGGNTHCNNKDGISRGAFGVEDFDDGWGGDFGSTNPDEPWGVSCGNVQGHASRCNTLKDDIWGGKLRMHRNDAGRGNETGVHKNDEDRDGKFGVHRNDDGWGQSRIVHRKDNYFRYPDETEKESQWEGSGNGRGSNSWWSKSAGKRDHGERACNANDVDQSNSRKRIHPSRGSREGFYVDLRPHFSEREGFERTTLAENRSSSPDVSGRSQMDGAKMSTFDEKEKIWFYQDPTKTIQGPFSMEQLRKWEKTKLFPADLKIWREADGQDASVLLTDVLLKRLGSDLPPGFAHFAHKQHVPKVNGWLASEDIRSARPSGCSRSWSDARDGGGRHKWVEDDCIRERGHTNDYRGTTESRSRGTQGSVRFSSGDDDRDSCRRFSQDIRHEGHTHRYSSHRGNDGIIKLMSKKDIPCRYFIKGICKKGGDCEFRH
ncbi:hypothetical protein KP509_03G088800 [Ceratopteris richardii]|uniref:Zinc finger CCCH domain-containing protein 44 n=1 Tax=Ceratopteris richardii TaxID=49495 RepID=A0A8T2V931_CERRI|nr:hypothetical protein KP509_03G088800 [Ceratopteris richardii]